MNTIISALPGLRRFLHRGEPNAELEALNWVDEFIVNVRPYIFVRLEDNLLMKRPNQAQKLNPTGALILARLNGFDEATPKRVVPDSIGTDVEKGVLS